LIALGAAAGQHVREKRAMAARMHGTEARTAEVPGSAVKICITNVPPGEAPEEIRRAWVGLELPLTRGEAEARMVGAAGALSNSPTAEPVTGYVFDGKIVVELLEEFEPAAAAWWRENAPEVMSPGYEFLFPEWVCARVENGSNSCGTAV
jgi:hypothetical protein